MSLERLPKVSIIMGIYNCESTIKESIESIISQTYTNWELIMCDDMSTDNTYEIAKKYVDKYSEKIILIQNEENSGLAFSLNHCLQYATGDYIARQDGDDMSVKDRFEKQVEFLEKNRKYDLVGSRMISFDENGINGVRGGGVEKPSHIMLTTSTPFCHATIMARSYVYKELNGYKVNKYTMRCEDVDLWFRFFEKGYKGYNIQEGLYMVRDEVDAYKRRSFKSYMHLVIVSVDGYKRVKMPLSKYVYLLKPIVSAIIPKSIMKVYHTKKCTAN